MKALKLFPLLALGGCSIYHISNEPNSGIRFYDIENIPTATLTCGQTWWELKLDVATSEDGKQNPRTFVAYATDPSAVAKLNARFASTWTAEDAWVALSGDFQDPTSNELLGDPPDALSVTKPDALSGLSLMSWSTDVRIAAGKEHYINVRRPVIGTASATVKLAPNGTLIETTASVDDQTISGIVTAVTSLVPISDIVSSKVGMSTSAEQSGGKPVADLKRVKFAIYSAVARTRTYTCTGPA